MDQAYLTDTLQVSLAHLRAIGCTPDAFTLSLTAWLGPAPEGGLSPVERQHFQTLHLLACDVLGEARHPPDLRTAGERSRAEIAELVQAYRWAGRAQQAHAEALAAIAT